MHDHVALTFKKSKTHRVLLQPKKVLLYVCVYHMHAISVSLSCPACMNVVQLYSYTSLFFVSLASMLFIPSMPAFNSNHHLYSIAVKLQFNLRIFAQFRIKIFNAEDDGGQVSRLTINTIIKTTPTFLLECALVRTWPNQTQLSVSICYYYSYSLWLVSSILCYQFASYNV